MSKSPTSPIFGHFSDTFFAYLVAAFGWQPCPISARYNLGGASTLKNLGTHWAAAWRDANCESRASTNSHEAHAKNFKHVPRVLEDSLLRDSNHQGLQPAKHVLAQSDTTQP